MIYLNDRFLRSLDRANNPNTALVYLDIVQFTM